MKTFRHPCAVDSLAYMPDGAILFSGDFRGVLHAWDLATGKHAVVVFAPPSTCLAVSPNGRWLVYSSLLCRIGPAPVPDASLLEDADRTDARFQFASGWTGRCLRSWPGESAFSPDSRLVAGQGDHGVMYLWKTARPAPIGFFDDKQILSRPTFSPDGKTLVTVFGDRTTDVGLALWDVKTRTLRQVEQLHYETIGAGSIPLYSADGQWLAVASKDRIHLHSVRPNLLEWIGALHGKSRKVIRTIAFSPDSNRLLSGGNDGIVRLWDVHAQKPIAEWDWEIGQVMGVAFAPDGMTAAAGGVNDRLVVWDLDE